MTFHKCCSFDHLCRFFLPLNINELTNQQSFLYIFHPAVSISVASGMLLPGPWVLFIIAGLLFNVCCVFRSYKDSSSGGCFFRKRTTDQPRDYSFRVIPAKRVSGVCHSANPIWTTNEIKPVTSICKIHSISIQAGMLKQLKNCEGNQGNGCSGNNDDSNIHKKVLLK